MTHYLILTQMPPDLNNLFLHELKDKTFDTINKEKDLCDCYKEAHAYYREIHLYEIDILETAEKSFEQWLNQWFQTEHTKLFQWLSKIFFRNKQYPFTKISIDKKVGMKLNHRNRILAKVSEPNRSTFVLCKGCNKKIPIDWL